MSIRLPRPDPQNRKYFEQRLIPELTKLLQEQQEQIEELRRKLYIETDLDRAPTRDGAVAVVVNDVYVGANGSWVQVN